MFDHEPAVKISGTDARMRHRRPASVGGRVPAVVERIAVLHRYRHVVVWALLLAVGGALLKTSNTLPMYRSQAQLLIDVDRQAVDVFRETYYVDPEPFLETQYGVLRSRGLARRIVLQLNLAQVPEFNGEGLELAALTRAWESATRLITDPISRFRGQQATADTPVPSAAMDRDDIQAERDEAVIDAFLSNLEITPVPNSRLVSIAFESADSELAARAANGLAEAYVELNREVQLQSANETLIWLAEETAKQKATVEASEHGLAEYREKQNELSLDEDQDIVIARLRTLNDAVIRAETHRAQKEALFNQVGHLDLDSAATASFPEVATEPGVREARARLEALETAWARLSGRYGAKHPAMIKAETDIEVATRQLHAESARAVRALRSEYTSAVAEVESLRAELETQKSAAMALNRKSVDYGVLERDTASERLIYQDLLRREKELRIESNLRVNQVRVISHASAPPAPFTPKKGQNLFFGVVVGLMLGVGLALGLETVNDTIKTPDDVTHKLKVPVLGLVPDVPGEQAPLLTGQVPAEFGEHFRSVRTALWFALPVQTVRVVAVTSAQPLEGKTTTACNLATVLALGGARVLLIDADMRRPSVHRTLDIPNGLGLSNVLAGQVSADKAIRRSSEPNLSVMTAGQVPPNPSELLASEAMRNLLGHRFMKKAPRGGGKRRNKSFDWIILDTPPVLAVTDAVSLAPWVSGVMVVLRAEMTNRRVAAQALELIMTAHPKSVGALLNRVNFKRHSFFYGRYYGYSRKYYDQRPSELADATTPSTTEPTPPRVSDRVGGGARPETFYPEVTHPELLPVALASGGGVAPQPSNDGTPVPRRIDFSFVAATLGTVVVLLGGVLVGRDVDAGLTSATGTAGAAWADSPSEAVRHAAVVESLDAAPSATDRADDRLIAARPLEADGPRAEQLVEPDAVLVAPTSPAVAHVPEPPPAPSAFTVQVAALAEPAAAQEIVDGLTAHGFPAFVVGPAPGAPVALFRVRVGRYPDRRDAEDVQRRLASEHQFTPWITS